MPRMCIVQQALGLSRRRHRRRPVRHAIRKLVGIDLGRDAVPDATTLLKFRRLLEENKLNERIFYKADILPAEAT